MPPRLRLVASIEDYNCPIQKILAEFDFELIRDLIVALGTTWIKGGASYVPSVEEIRDTAKTAMHLVKDKDRKHPFVIAELAGFIAERILDEASGSFTYRLTYPVLRISQKEGK